MSPVATFAQAHVRFDPPRWYSILFTTIQNDSLHHNALSYEHTDCICGNSRNMTERICNTYREGNPQSLARPRESDCRSRSGGSFPSSPGSSRSRRSEANRHPRADRRQILKRWFTIAVAGGLAASTVGAAVPREQVLTVPGFADFLAVDGATVWVTNNGRVERWSMQKKRAEVTMSHPCGAMAIAAGSLWVADCQERTLNRIDLKTAIMSAVIATGIASPDGELNVVAGAGSVWVASDAKGVVVRVDQTTNRVTASVRVDPGSCYLAFGYGSLWAVSATTQVLQKIDPITNAVVKRTKLGRQPGFLAAGEGAVWVQEQADGTVARINPTSGRISGRIKVDKTLNYGDIDTGGGKVWLRTTLGQTFVVIDPSSLVVLARIGKAYGSGALRYTPTGVWTTAHDLQILSRWLNPETIGN